MEKPLDQLLSEAIEAFDKLSPEEQKAHREAQRQSYVRAELSWPAPKFRMVNGVKVYDSYKDYLND